MKEPRFSAPVRGSWLARYLSRDSLAWRSATAEFRWETSFCRLSAWAISAASRRLSSVMVESICLTMWLKAAENSPRNSACWEKSPCSTICTCQIRCRRRACRDLRQPGRIPRTRIMGEISPFEKEASADLTAVSSW